jgi:glycosyltransferase involved in cell wall biosynthesis
MATLPRISIVTPSYNQGRYLARTLESVQTQDYPNLEHIVVDGLSTDETPQVLARYPHLRVIRERDRGQADALNKGFRLATGDLLAFLNSDDTYLPGALHRVARELDARKDRHVVVGRCVYVDEHDTPTGLEHPSGLVDPQQVLEVWKVSCVPQPATFWTREVWQRCGPLDERERLALDYDLFCRFSRHYRFHWIDQVLATYRLHTGSRSSADAPHERVEGAIDVSRRYWGSPLAPQYWRLLGSLANHRLEQRWGRRRQAAQWRLRGYHAWEHGQPVRSVAWLLASTTLAPEVLLRPWLPRRRTEESPLTRAWMSFTGLHRDKSAGPRFVTHITVAAEHRMLYIDGAAVLPGLPRPLNLEVMLDGRQAHHEHLARGCHFSIGVPVAGLSPGEHELCVCSSAHLVLDDHLANGDYRPLSFRLRRLLLTE